MLGERLKEAKVRGHKLEVLCFMQINVDDELCEAACAVTAYASVRGLHMQLYSIF